MNDASELVDVKLIGFPLDEYQRSQQLYDDLFRELALISEQTRQHDKDIPSRLTILVKELTAKYAGLSAATDIERDAAIARGDKSVDLSFSVPPGVKQACVDFDGLLDEADDFCRNGELLSLAMPPGIVKFRQWYLQEFEKQIDGGPPIPWDEYHNGN